MRIVLIGAALIATMPAAVFAARDQRITLTEQSSDRVTTLRRHQAAFLTLQTNPTTGYSWQVDAGPGVKVIKTRTQPTRPGVPGAPSVDHYKIVAIARGNHEVSFRYLRPWEKDKAIKTLTYRFRVL